MPLRVLRGEYSDSVSCHIVLVGAGHAHLGVLRDCKNWGHRVTVVSPGDFWYSGLATGTLGGQYAIEEDKIDVAALCRRVGARFVKDRLSGLDAAAKRITLADGEPLDYDVLSLDLGSEVSPLEGLGNDDPRVFAAKPIARLADLRRAVEAGKVRRVAVVGGGYSGCETALNLAGLLRRTPAKRPAQVTLYAGDDGPVARLPAAARSAVRDALGAAGVRRFDERLCRAEPCGEGVMLRRGGGRLAQRADALLNATGLRPPQVVASLDLPLTDAGRLRLRDTLQIDGHDAIFAAGDSATLAGRDLPQIGVVAVRQGEVLSHNLPAAADGRPLKTYAPQKRHLLILNLADGTGLAVWGKWHYRGKLALWLKSFIDRRFLAGLQKGDAD